MERLRQKVGKTETGSDRDRYTNTAHHTKRIYGQTDRQSASHEYHRGETSIEY